MNFIFVSPHFPNTYWNFCDRLHRNGVNVLGIGDAPFDEIPGELKHCLTEYYRVDNLGSYEEMLRAVAYFTFHYGKIDWIESNNEYWLEMDAQLRTDFNINTGAKNDFIERIKYKSRMKESYRAAGVPVARHHMVSTLAAARAFIKEVGYPVIVKPDNGCGAEATYKLKNFSELKKFYAEPHAVQYIMEEYINGTIVSFDGVADSHCVPLFYTSNVFPTPLLDIVSKNGDLSYWTQKTVPAALKDVGFRTIKAFGAKSRFFHCEFFQLNEDKPGLGKKGDYVALEVNMRPAGGYTPDMINYANSVDCYQIWADMVCYDEVRSLDLNGHKYFCVYAGRRDCHQYKHTHAQILARYGSRIKMCGRIPQALRLDMGDQMYTAVVRSTAERDAFIRYVQEQA
ncbi:MAG: ATP-grasp domain-containing protein [Gemmiger sp.]|uniref:ATP-grasp domain-containing protein n=1 Tax=Gemmiger sp. TaxID=2049027 RepID=UPI002E786985|nr:ATP-grasp domain-containing protein [Gemmiger sp.]MEE1423282.1 ATP-grasp domain-containing protein [Gemmiger sp.]